VKAITTTLAVIAVAGASSANTGYSQIPKPFEVSAGGVFFTGDIKSVWDVSNGWLIGIDYHVNQFGQNATGFVGARGYFASQNGVKVNTYGLHYGVKFGMPMSSGGANPMGGLYAKLAGGYYNTDNDQTTNAWGFGGFVAIGWEMQGGFSIEGGYQLGPSVAGDNNTSWYVAGTFRF
jgi:hypothetical protein